MGLFKCLNFQSFPLYLSKRKASVHFHEQMPCLKAVFLQPPCFILYFSGNYIIGIGSFGNVSKGTCY